MHHPDARVASRPRARARALYPRGCSAILVLRAEGRARSGAQVHRGAHALLAPRQHRRREVARDPSGDDHALPHGRRGARRRGHHAGHRAPVDRPRASRRPHRRPRRAALDASQKVDAVHRPGLSRLRVHRRRAPSIRSCPRSSSSTVPHSTTACGNGNRATSRTTGSRVLAVDLPGHGRSPGVVAHSHRGMGRVARGVPRCGGRSRKRRARGPQHGLAHRAGGRAAARRSACRSSRSSAPPRRCRWVTHSSPPRATIRRSAFDMEAVWGHARHSQLAHKRRARDRRCWARAAASTAARGPARCSRTSRHATPTGRRCEAVRALDVPTLVVAGKRDQMTPVQGGQGARGGDSRRALRRARRGALDDERGAARDAGGATSFLRELGVLVGLQAERGCLDSRVGALLLLQPPHLGEAPVRRDQAAEACRARRCAPWSSTRISSASTTVESRCAITSVVRSREISASSAWIDFSVRESSAEVASSKMRIGGFFSTRARDRHALLLAAGELQAALAHRRLPLVGQALDEVVRCAPRAPRPPPPRASPRGGRRRCCSRSCR